MYIFVHDTNDFVNDYALDNYLLHWMSSCLRVNLFRIILNRPKYFYCGDYAFVNGLYPVFCIIYLYINTMGNFQDIFHGVLIEKVNIA